MKLNLNYIDKDTKNIIIGVSAGPDSMALLHYMINNYNYKIICAHINHNVRKESKEEELYLKEYCKKNKVIFESMQINEYKENNFENEARKKRYEFYLTLLKKYDSKYLFLAHHGDDLIETILMKIARGSNLEGYAGIKKINKFRNKYIIRPLLDYTKDDLLNYCKKNKIKYYIDKSNFDNKYTRNRYRNNILPFLKKEDINIHKKFIMFSNTLLEYNNYIKHETNKLVNVIYKNHSINVDDFNKIDIFMQKNILYYILNNIYDNKNNILSIKHINNILKICKNKKNTKIYLPKNIIATKEYNKLSFITNNNNNDYKVLLNKTQIIDNHVIKVINKTNQDGNNICRLNSKNINLPLYIRNKKDGDKIEVLGLNGHKKISDIFIEKKVPNSLRKKYPIVVDNKDNIIWIPNLKKSKFNIKKNEFYDIILEYCEKEEK